MLDNWWKKTIGLVSSFGVLLGFFVAFGAYHQDYALASETLKLREEIKLMHNEYKDAKNTQRAQYLQSEIWKLDDRYEGRPKPIDAKDRYRILEMELKILRNKGY